MGKTVGGHPEAPAVTPAASAGGLEPIGRYLAQQRKLRGLSLDELSSQTRIPRRSLERLEAGAFDRTPDGFARGFVRTVAAAIGLDPDETVARMLAEPTGAARSLPRAGGPVLALLVIALVALLAYAASNLDFGSSSEPALVEPAAGLPVRHDYVRELAAERGLAPATLDPADAALPAEPPAPEPPTAEVAAPELASEPPAAAPAGSPSPPPAIAPPPAPVTVPAAAPPARGAPRAAIPEPAAADPLAAPAAAAGDAHRGPAAETTDPEPVPPPPSGAGGAPPDGAAPLEAGIPAPAESPAAAALEAPAEVAPAAEPSEAAPASADTPSERAEDPD